MLSNAVYIISLMYDFRLLRNIEFKSDVTFLLLLSISAV